MLIDRLTNLPDELLIRIVSLLPTKDAAVITVLSRRLSRVFPLITSLDFDGSPISFCVRHPYATQRYPTFVSFVDNVLQAHQSRYLTKFRLQVSSRDFARVFYNNGCYFGACKHGCVPDLNSPRLNAWISYPLTLCGLRELDLCILVRYQDVTQLPPTIFTCETLEVLKLEVNIGLDHVYTMPSYRLPNLKLLLLSAFVIDEDGFLSRLVSSCPVLEDLTIKAISNRVKITTITSTSLLRMCLNVRIWDDFEDDYNELVLINTPNLEYLDYRDHLAKCYSIPTMHRLIKADLCVIETLDSNVFEVSFQKIINLIRPLSYVQHLSLQGFLVPGAEKVLKDDQLPVFHNLKHLELGETETYCWNKLLLHFLNSSPVLETLVFQEGLVLNQYEGTFGDDITKKELELEREFFRTDHEIPVCCIYHLRRIVIKEYFGIEREVVISQFFLRHALVLEELVICLARDRNEIPYQNQMSFENTLKNLPKASVTCSIQVI